MKVPLYLYDDCSCQSRGKKLKKFSGLNFKWWQQKILFYLTTLNLPRFLTEESPKSTKDATDVQTISAVKAWKNYLLNYLAELLYIVYSTKKIAKELWEFLDRKYKTEDVKVKKFIVVQFLDYKMVDSKIVIN